MMIKTTTAAIWEMGSMPAENNKDQNSCRKVPAVCQEAGSLQELPAVCQKGGGMDKRKEVMKTQLLSFGPFQHSWFPAGACPAGILERGDMN